MSNYIVLYNFNKYYNRKVIRFSTFAEYEALITPSGNTPAQFTGFKRQDKNFFMNDGIYAKHVINISKDEPLALKADQPDYFVLQETFQEKSGNTYQPKTKITRWFVLEATRIRGDQYELSLRRDLLADYYSEVLNAPVFIERGAPTNYSDPALFNKEGFTFNQIKKYEILLNRNKLSGKGAGWIVGYLNREDDPTDLGPCKCKQEMNLDVYDYDDLPTAIKNALDGNNVLLDAKNTCHVTFPIKIVNTYDQHGPINHRYRDIHMDIDGGTFRNTEVKTSTSTNGSYPYFMYDYSIDGSSGNSRSWTDVNIYYYTIRNISDYYPVATAFQALLDADVNLAARISQALMDEYNGAYYIKDGKYYKIEFQSQNSTELYRKMYTGAQITSLYDNLAYASLGLLDSLCVPASTPEAEVIKNPNWDLNSYAISIERNLPYYKIVSVETDATEFEVTIPKERNQLLDSPYDMFVIPFGAITVKGRTGEANFTTYLNTALATARGIAAKGTSTRVLDIQILPYCPFDEVIDSNGDIDLTNALVDKDYTIIEKDFNGETTPIGIILYPLHSIGTFRINLYEYRQNNVISADCYGYLTADGDLFSKKVKSETSFVRFVSPNFAAIYDMNPQKNGLYGATVIDVDYYYKPYTPYLHIKPIFEGETGLYGIETKDPKGLICSGDFSIATASSKWEEYQIQNKNLQNQFDRQIQNLDVNNSIALEQQKVTGGIGIATAGLSGAAAGAVAGAAGGPIGAIIGGAVGAVAGVISSWIGYAKDMDNLKKSQSEARGYATDMYTYQLGNVQALPNTLNKVSAFTPNNKIFPFIEVYTCTDEEKAALRNKIKYNGMTIMRIGHINDFINTNITRYVQGKLIRLEGINEDSHVIGEIASEIKEGAYFYGSDTSES